ncbi:MAG: tRNA uridine-5-carboxymethylaminomethyl(34) synthesis GTPase MnmE [Bradymonadaceae bacterium]|nr:tRNA uridine-5-carboxymethylaminomethyl(34) synthesis GTPase MnmE [Lujinxingiaceae bacterium]
MSTSITTIAAIATPPGKGGVGIVRVSGPRAAEILQALVADFPADFASHKLRHSRIVDATGELIDVALAVLMRAPHSYTGEPVVEFQCHGGPIILRRVLDAVLLAGAEVAEPGQFTQRAFLNGRLDLTQAEAVADLVNATTESAHKLAVEHLQGRLGQAIGELAELIAQAAVLVEAAIDFSHEEHVYQIEHAEVAARIDRVLAELTGLRARFDEGRRQREGVHAVILGPTNAGKSTLFNLLHGTERAIVTPVAGTTRDFLEEEIHLGGVALRLVDTAGLRVTEDQVEAIGIARSRELGQRADLVIWLVDRSVGLEPEERDQLENLLAQGRPTLVVTNKSDLPAALSPEDERLLKEFEHVVATALTAQPPEGTSELRATLAAVCAHLTAAEGVLISRTRHLQAVLRALEALQRARQALDDELQHEFIALDLRDALDALGDITGRVTSDDILNRIFSEFCVGK